VVSNSKKYSEALLGDKKKKMCSVFFFFQEGCLLMSEALSPKSLEINLRYEA